MAKIALIVYGPPGSGKGTQANLASDKLGLIHFDTGKFLEAVVHDPANINDPVIQKERELFDTGILMTPSFVLDIAKKKTRDIAAANFGIAYSGSPRTLYEAEGLIPELESLFPKENIIPIVLQVTPETSIRRNSARALCATCGMTILKTLLPNPDSLQFCVFCGSSFKHRTLDKPEVIEVRLKEYKERTEPIFEFLKRRGYDLIPIDGEPVPYKVHQNILEEIAERVKN